ncbi:MAG TPA: thioesterase family protein [Candidatus Eisenbacteria bacterium]|nr:thioesterase family protein [Candidatus Eisenbacteria bacterium]
MSFQATIPVRFQDVDAAGVLFFGRIFDYCHQAYEELIGSFGLDRAHYFAGAEYLVPIVHARADYRSPIRLGERVHVTIEIARVGRASVRLRYRVTGPKADDLRAEVETVHAFVDRATMRPISIPDPLRGFFLEHLVPDAAAEGVAK